VLQSVPAVQILVKRQKRRRRTRIARSPLGSMEPAGWWTPQQATRTWAMTVAFKTRVKGGATRFTDAQPRAVSPTFLVSSISSCASHWKLQISICASADGAAKPAGLSSVFQQAAAKQRLQHCNLELSAWRASRMPHMLSVHQHQDR
jgi:hypothetical protein